MSRNPPQYPPPDPFAPHRPSQAVLPPTKPPHPVHQAPNPLPYAPMPDIRYPAPVQTITISNECKNSRENARTRDVRVITKQDEELFVREYIRTGRNETLAGKRIGLLDNQLRSFMKRKRVQELLRTWAIIGLSAQDITLDRVLLTLGSVAFLDHRTLFDDDGNPLPLHELPDQAVAALHSVQSTGQNGQPPSYKFMPKMEALKTMVTLLKPTAAAVTINNNQNNSQNTQVNIESLSIGDLQKLLHIQSNAPAESTPLLVDEEE